MEGWERGRNGGLGGREGMEGWEGGRNGGLGGRVILYPGYRGTHFFSLSQYLQNCPSANVTKSTLRRGGGGGGALLGELINPALVPGDCY